MVMQQRTPLSGEGSPTAADSRPTSSKWRAAHRLSTGLTLLVLSASLCGLLINGVYGQPASVAQMLRGYDLTTLVIVVPGLVLAQAWARRRSDRAQLLWVGLLAYVVYTYAYYLFGTSFNGLLLLHVLVFAGSLGTLIVASLALDTEGIASRFAPRTPRRSVSAVLGLLAAALGGLWLYWSTRSVITGQVPPGSALVEPDAVVHLGIALDLALLVPAYVLASVLLWRGAAAGYLLAAALLSSGTLHQVSYMVALGFQAMAGIPGAAAFDPVEPLITALYLVPTAVLFFCAGRARTDLRQVTLTQE
jgi:hypothetical protein